MNPSATVSSRPAAVDWLLAGAAVVAVCGESTLALHRVSPWLPVFAAAIGAAVLFRRSRPLLVMGITTVLMLAAMPVVRCNNVALLIEMLVAATAAHTGRRHSLLVAAAVLPVVGVAYWLADIHGGVTHFAFYVLLLLAAVASGDALRSRRVARQSRERQRAAERDAAAREMFDQLRSELSRELHDSLGHSLVAISTRASVAVHVANRSADPELLSALRDVASVSADALEELRATLRTLERRRTGPDTNFEALARPLRSAGIDVSFSVGGELHAAYRILQESLTNVLRHSAATLAEVSLNRTADGLAIEVTNDGVSKAPCTGGHGIRNMQVRASQLGGTVEAERSLGGTWHVRAWIPEAG